MGMRSFNLFFILLIYFVFSFNVQADLYGGTKSVYSRRGYDDKNFSVIYWQSQYGDRVYESNKPNINENLIDSSFVCYKKTDSKRSLASFALYFKDNDEVLRYYFSYNNKKPNPYKEKYVSFWLLFHDKDIVDEKNVIQEVDGTDYTYLTGLLPRKLSYLSYWYYKKVGLLRLDSLIISFYRAWDTPELTNLRYVYNNRYKIKEKVKIYEPGYSEPYYIQDVYYDKPLDIVSMWAARDNMYIMNTKTGDFTEYYLRSWTTNIFSKFICDKVESKEVMIKIMEESKEKLIFNNINIRNGIEQQRKRYSTEYSTAIKKYTDYRNKLILNYLNSLDETKDKIIINRIRKNLKEYQEEFLELNDSRNKDKK
tara:strand:+ start:87 stop:1187 length:1101 start_codon:yes stop_codon:yes gene_type:complete